MNKEMLAVETKRTTILSRKNKAEKALEELERKYGLRDKDGAPNFSNYYSEGFKRRVMEIASINDRRKMIRLHREKTICANEFQEIEIERTRAQLHEAKRYGNISREIAPIVIGIFFVWLGSQVDGVIGAIGGAVVGIFAGLSYIRNNEAERKFFVRNALDDLKSELSEKKYHFPLQHLFSEEDESA